MVWPSPVRTKSSMVSAWAVRGRVKGEARKARVKRALRIVGFPSFELWVQDAPVRGRSQGLRLVRVWRGTFGLLRGLAARSQLERRRFELARMRTHAMKLHEWGTWRMVRFYVWATPPL